MQVRFLGQENPLEKEMATHSSILAWKIPWMEEPGRLQTRLSDFTFFPLYVHRISEPVHQRVQFPNRHISCVPQLH